MMAHSVGWRRRARARVSHAPSLKSRRTAARRARHGAPLTEDVPIRTPRAMTRRPPRWPAGCRPVCSTWPCVLVLGGLVMGSLGRGRGSDAPGAVTLRLASALVGAQWCCTRGPAGPSGAAVGVRTWTSRRAGRSASRASSCARCRGRGLRGRGRALRRPRVAVLRPDPPQPWLARPRGRRRGPGHPRGRSRSRGTARRAGAGRAERTTTPQPPGWAVVPATVPDGQDGAAATCPTGAAGRAWSSRRSRRGGAGLTWTRGRFPSCVRSGSSPGLAPELELTRPAGRRVDLVAEPAVAAAAISRLRRSSSATGGR